MYLFSGTTSKTCKYETMCWNRKGGKDRQLKTFSLLFSCFIPSRGTDCIKLCHPPQPRIVQHSFYDWRVITTRKRMPIPLTLTMPPFCHLPSISLVPPVELINFPLCHLDSYTRCKNSSTHFNSRAPDKRIKETDNTLEEHWRKVGTAESILSQP